MVIPVTVVYRVDYRSVSAGRSRTSAERGGRCLTVPLTGGPG